MKKILLLSILFASIAIVGCKKKDTPALTTESDTNDVYVAGVSVKEKEKEKIAVATLWHNGVEQVLSNSDSWAYSLFVSGNDVYVAGVIENTPTVWKNGVPQSLSLISGVYFTGWASSIFVSNAGDVYVAGSVIKENKEVPALWKNGILQTLSDGTSDAGASSVFLSGNDVYVAGYIKNGSEYSSNSVATLWKNGVPQSLSDGTTNADATSVYLSGGDVYVAGYINNSANNPLPILWKNGNKQTLAFPDGYTNTREDLFLNLFISNKIVYTVGESVLWTNNVPSIVAGNCGAAISIYVFNKDVYIAGAAYPGIPAIWKNGIYQILNTIPGGCAYGIFVK